MLYKVGKDQLPKLPMETQRHSEVKGLESVVIEPRLHDSSSIALFTGPQFTRIAWKWEEKGSLSMK